MTTTKYDLTMKDYKWMGMCVAGAEIFSTCSKARYMAIIIDTNGRVVGMGWNGGPSGYKHCVDGGCPRAKQSVEPGSNYDNCISIHAEENAFLNSAYPHLNGGTLYVNGEPCYGCAKKIINSGVKRLVYLETARYNNWPEIESFLETNGVATCLIR